MDVIDREWISSRLSGTRGEKAALAVAMGVTRDIVTKILNGERKVQGHEVPAVLRFFRADDDSQAARVPGFAETGVVPYRADAMAGPPANAIIALFAPALAEAQVWAVARNYPAFGVQENDTIVVDPRRRAVPGDLVVAQVVDQSVGAGVTHIARHVPPYLLTGEPVIDANPMPLAGRGDLVVSTHGVVLGVARTLIKARAAQGTAGPTLPA
jgi:hypothetical protein